MFLVRVKVYVSGWVFMFPVQKHVSLNWKHVSLNWKHVFQMQKYKNYRDRNEKDKGQE
jgi:hypothetical protein